MHTLVGPTQQHTNLSKHEIKCHNNVRWCVVRQRASEQTKVRKIRFLILTGFSIRRRRWRAILCCRECLAFGPLTWCSQIYELRMYYDTKRILFSSECCCVISLSPVDKPKMLNKRKKLLQRVSHFIHECQLEQTQQVLLSRGFVSLHPVSFWSSWAA